MPPGVLLILELAAKDVRRLGLAPTHKQTYRNGIERRAARTQLFDQINAEYGPRSLATSRKPHEGKEGGADGAWRRASSRNHVETLVLDV